MSKKNSSDSGNDKRLVVYISQEMFDTLERLAISEDRSISNYTRNLIAKALEKEIGKNT